MTTENSPSAFDWEAVKARLARASQGGAEGQRPSAQRTRAILDERARALAAVTERPPAAAEILEVVAFALGAESYALETRMVRRVLPVSPTTPLPGVNALLSGLINLRGELLPVFDLRSLLGVAARPPTDRSRIFVLGDQRDDLGLWVDEARGVLTLRREEVLDPALAATRAGGLPLRGVTTQALILLDGEMLLRDPRLVIDQGDD